MKKLTAFLTILLVSAIIAGCDSGKLKKGEIATFGQDENGENMYFELVCEDENIAFRITEETELVVEDKGVLDFLGIAEDEFDFDFLSGAMTVTVVAGDAAESADSSLDDCVSGWYYAEKITVNRVNEVYYAVDEKPVIYLYPEKPTQVSVKLDYKGKLFCTYPKYDGGWEVTANPDGTLVDKDGKEYNYLYWEGTSPVEYDFSEGFCIKGADSAEFLEDALSRLGLSRREANEFIVYWLPCMEKNEYNLISFQSEVYTENAHLDITPAPDTFIRVFMATKPVSSPVEIPAQELSSPEREGFTVVEWGGAQVS